MPRPPARRERFTPALLRSLEPGATAYDTDVPALGVRVLPSGRASFFVREAVGGRGGRQGFVTLGAFGPVTIPQARKLAATAAGTRASAGSAADARDAARAAVRARVAAATVAELADVFLTECAAKLKPTTVSEWRRLLGVVPVKRGPDAGGERAGELRAALGARKVADVTRGDVARCTSACRRARTWRTAHCGPVGALHVRRAPRPPAGRLQPVPPRRARTPSTSASAT
jgi:hypothetical protein